MKNRDSRILRIFSVLHYVLAIPTVIGLLAVSPYYLAGIMGFLRAVNDPSIAANPSESFTSWADVILVSAFYILVWLQAILLILAGIKLWKKKSRNFCLIVAGVECIIIPFGTLLGIFTLLALTRDSVKGLFANPPSSDVR